MKYFVCLSMFFSISLCAKAESVHLEVEVIENKDKLFEFPAKFAVKFNAEFSSGEKLLDVVLFQSTIPGNSWSLRIDRNLESPNSNKNDININEYESLISSILEYISNNDELGINKIRINYRLVDSTWKDIISAVKESAKSRAGKVTLMDKTTANTITTVLQKSDIVNRTCSLLSKYSYTCEMPRLAGEDVAFQEEYIDKNWHDISESEDGGLNKTLWFSIIVKSVD